VQALAKSSPRECLGKDVAGEAEMLAFAPGDSDCCCCCMYTLSRLSWGESGTSMGRGKCEGEGMELEEKVLPSGGICKDRPRDRKSGRRAGRLGFGVVGRAWSSLLCCVGRFSRKDGEGASAGGVLVGVLALGGSEKERDFEGVLSGSKEGGKEDAVADIVLYSWELHWLRCDCVGESRHCLIRRHQRA